MSIIINWGDGNDHIFEADVVLLAGESFIVSGSQGAIDGQAGEIEGVGVLRVLGAGAINGQTGVTDAVGTVELDAVTGTGAVDGQAGQVDAVGTAGEVEAPPVVVPLTAAVPGGGAGWWWERIKPKRKITGAGRMSGAAGGVQGQGMLDFDTYDLREFEEIEELLV